jgi:hypothetical protein
MCFLVNQRIKTFLSVQDLEYSKNYRKYIAKYSGYQRGGETVGRYHI